MRATKCTTINIIRTITTLWCRSAAAARALGRQAEVAHRRRRRRRPRRRHRPVSDLRPPRRPPRSPARISIATSSPPRPAPVMRLRHSGTIALNQKQTINDSNY